MNRIDRLIGMMTLLQSKKYCTIEKLCDKFNIGVRTVYRDIKALNEIGVPVHFENGKGYFISQGFFLPPLSLTIEEANALVLLNTLADKFADNSIVKHSRGALDKIKAALRYADKDKSDQLSSQINVYVPETERNEKNNLSQIQNAIINKTILGINYTDNNGKHSRREIEPIGLVFYTLQWHLYAWCNQKHGYRDFKVNRISNLLDTGKPHSIKEHLKMEDYIKSF